MSTPGPAKRKRRHDEPATSATTVQTPGKRTKSEAIASCHPGDGSYIVEHALLTQLYPCLKTLRGYLLSKLPASSRIRRRKIASIGRQNRPPSKSGSPLPEIEQAVAHLLDTTLIGFSDATVVASDNRWEQWTAFSQRGDDSYVTLSDGTAGAFFSQSEIVDFVVWLLFSRQKSGSNRVNHLLCDGFRRDINYRPHGAAPQRCGEIPGLFALHKNCQVQELKQSPWPQLLMLLGKAGERVMIDLLLDCAVFTEVASGRGNYCQLSGIPVSELSCCPRPPPGLVAETPSSSRRGGSGTVAARSPSTITFVRSRMLYARAALNARGLVQFGLRHIHVLNRFPLKPQHKTSSVSGSGGPGEGGSPACDETTLRVLMYMFPRQFGLHNVFTSEVDRSQTAQKFQDYTLREEEIAVKFNVVEDGVTRLNVRIPKRLRGLPVQLVRKLQTLHSRCAYWELLQHYCPMPGEQDARRRPQPSPGNMSVLPRKSQGRQAQPRKRPKQPPSQAPQPPKYSSLVELATPVAQVSAFCQAVLRRIIPLAFWGQGPTQFENRAVFLKKVDDFLHLRRFEQISLHDVMQGLKIMEIKWLQPTKLSNQKSSQTDRVKRVEIFHEFLYYVFDSLLIPLIRSNFYVTDSSAHRYRLFFFRHDVWRQVAEPAMASLKTRMFQEIKTDEALQILYSRRLGFSQLRLLPKGLTVRPIMNLRRRTMVRGNRKMLGPSINTILGPVNSVLKLEKVLNPRRLGSAMFSVADIYGRIKAFKSAMRDFPGHFYFAKLDVQAAFDNMPQDAVLELMRSIPSHAGYQIMRHVEVSPNDMAQGVESRSNPTKKWQSLAKRIDDSSMFARVLEERLAPSTKNTVFVESVVRKTYDTKGLMSLLASHVQENLVKIGKKYYRQKTGIPQGSVLSSTLCNYFYADLELKKLPFLQAEDCLLLRLIDDFLLITRDKAKARLFVETMHQGVPEYGVTVNPSKTLINFSMTTSDGAPVPRVAHGQLFPYCGTLIDCRTLDISKNHNNLQELAVFDSLTVEFSRRPGQNFKRKILNAFKIQSHVMFYDTAHNTQKTTLGNMYHAFVETATKAWAYIRCLPKEKRPSPRLVVAAAQDLINVAFLLFKSKSRAARYPGYHCGITKSEVAWLAMVAFRKVFSTKQAGFGGVISWLEGEIRIVETQKGFDPRPLMRAVKELR
ncbi:hypothetical protein VTK73DRAFT_6636 [Phialemonium thermophilum]|uniref:Telomerase reverse transcriptase n=1 Tax=Phialemonium thermophilum TaxID=223376 RepID=A0ABR3XVA0_9PEZI